MWKIVFLALAAVIAVGYGSKLVGGVQDVDLNTDEGARNALKFSVVQHNRATNDPYLSQVAEVIKVQRQVVSGMKYIITVKMAKTPCRKGSANEGCAIHQNPELARYTINYQIVKQVFDQAIPVHIHSVEQTMVE